MNIATVICCILCTFIGNARDGGHYSTCIHLVYALQEQLLKPTNGPAPIAFSIEFFSFVTDSNPKTHVYPLFSDISFILHTCVHF